MASLGGEIAGVPGVVQKGLEGNFGLISFRSSLYRRGNCAQRGEGSDLVGWPFFWRFQVLPSPCQHPQTSPSQPSPGLSLLPIVPDPSGLHPLPFSPLKKHLLSKHPPLPAFPAPLPEPTGALLAFSPQHLRVAVFHPCF